MNNNLAHSDVLPGKYFFQTLNGQWLRPSGLSSVPPVVDAEHDGEGGGRNHLFLVVVEQAVGCRHSKSIANLRRVRL